MENRYQAPLTLESSLKNLSAEYKSRSKANFTDPTSSKFSMFFGAKDIETRQNQIALLQVAAEIKDPCHSGNDKDAYFDKYQIMIALSYITLKQISSSSKICPIGSELYKLIDKSLNLKNNSLDQNTINECMYTLKKCDKQAINDVLRDKGQSEYTQTQWEELKLSAMSHIQKISDTGNSNVVNSFSSVGGLVMRPIGWGIGFSFGQTLGQIGTAAPAKAALTTAIGTGFIVLGPYIGSGVAAATLLARPHAEKAVEYAIGYGSAQACGYAFKKFGQGVGYVVGKGVELAIDATSTVTSKAINIVSSGAVVNIPIKVGLDLVSKDLIAKSEVLSHEEFIKQIQQVVSEHELAITKEEGNCSKEIIEPRVLHFDINNSEQKQLLNVLKTLGYTNNKKSVGLLESAKEANELKPEMEAATM